MGDSACSVSGQGPLVARERRGSLATPLPSRFTRSCQVQSPIFSQKKDPPRRTGTSLLRLVFHASFESGPC